MRTKRLGEMAKVELSRAETEAAWVYLNAFKILEALEPHLCPDCKRDLQKIRRC